MFILVSGGAASGKSAFAEGLIDCATQKTRIYLATMQVWDEESEHRVTRHRAMRAQKGFDTLECPTGLAQVALPSPCAVLLEDLTNLAANELFGGAPTGAVERVQQGLAHLKCSAALTVVVTGELCSDGILYGADTMDYLATLAQLNRRAAALADVVYEVVCGIPVCWKGSEE